MPVYIYTPIIAESHTPPYKIHKYFARRPHNVFRQLIKNFTEPGEIVLDPFMGGGVTIYEGLSNGRKVVGCDLNPLSTFIVRNMIKKSDMVRFNESIADLNAYITSLHADYMYFKKGDKNYPIDWAEMALCIRCPNCGRPTPLTNQLKVKVGKYHCSNIFCTAHTEDIIEIKNCERSEPKYVYLVHSSGKSNIIKEFDSEDQKLYNAHLKFLKSEILKNDISVSQDLIPIDWDRQFEDGLCKKGILYFQDFFTKRNLYILLLAKKKIDSYKDTLGDELYELLRIVFSSILKDTNIMSFTNDSWQSGKPTTWSKHAYWIPNQFCEVAILPSFDKAVKKVVASVNYNLTKDYIPNRVESFNELADGGNIVLFNTSITHTNIPNNSVDAIITDPPYGSNVQYLELSHFWYPWNKDLYERYPVFEIEAISNRKRGFKGAKSQYDYERNLFVVFDKSYRCLKPGRFMTLTFNNKDMSAWLALLFSIFKAGFTFHEIYFQDGVKNYKQTAHTKAKGSPYGDFIYVFKKDALEHKSMRNFSTEEDFRVELNAVFTHHLGNVDDRNLTILDMFKEALPSIEAFAKTYLRTHNKHTLYSFFNKKYLDKLYKIQEDEN